MSEPFVGEIKIVSFSYPPRGWAFCNGQLLPVAQNRDLANALGTTYGGDGTNTVGIPNLQGRVPIHRSDGHKVAESGGETTHTLNMSEMPKHTHPFQGRADNSNATNIPTGNVLVNSAPNNLYGPQQNLVAANRNTIPSAGGSQAHENMQPYLVLTYVIALRGVIPSPGRS